MAAQFSSDGKYFAILSNEGKLKIWNAINGDFEQEYSPDHHLSSPCRCLQFINSQSSSNKGSSPKKKKRRDSLETNSTYIVLGTATGLLLGYSISNASVTFTINSKINQEITCLSWIGSSTIYSGANQTILCWDLEKQILKDKWKCNENITTIKEIPQNKLLTASKTIKLWDTKSKGIIRIFTGHSSEVSVMEYICPKGSSDAYFISASTNDRLLNCWTLSEQKSEKNAIASFLMDDVARHVSIIISSDNTINMAALTRSGQVHVYQHILNGKCNKPLKPKTTIQVVSDTGQSGSGVIPIIIMGVLFQKDLSLLICHGSTILLTFECVIINTQEKLQCLVRTDPKTIKAAKQTEMTKFRSPLVENNVQYLTPHTTMTTTLKRKSGGSQEVPMEQRLENLTLTKSDITSKVPKVDNVAQLLIQGLHSKDKNILRSVLSRRDEGIIKSTIKRLPMAVLIPLFQELTTSVQGKTLSSFTASLWLKNLLQIHAGLLLSNPQLPELLDPILGSIQSRLLLQTPLNRLRGRLDLLMSQVNVTGVQEGNESDEPLLVYVDKDSSDSENENIDMLQTNSASEDEWSEEENENGAMEEDKHTDSSESENENHKNEGSKSAESESENSEMST